MIKANGLRLGNYVLIDGKLTQVVAIDKDGINGSWSPEDMYYDFDYNYSHGSLEGVPLTEDVFSKCKNEYENIIFRLEKIYSAGYHVEIVGEGWVSNLIIEYLHEYQNVYYSLTCSELPIYW